MSGVGGCSDWPLWSTPVSFSFIPSFTLEPGKQNHSGIADMLGSRSRDQAICGCFGFSSASFAEQSQGIATHLIGLQSGHLFFFC